jgi:hypothetical protein
VASQFHPEFKSRPERPHPLFDGFVASAISVRAGETADLKPRASSVRHEAQLARPEPEAEVGSISIAADA